MKEVQEGAEPTAAAVSVSNLYRLAHLIDAKDNEYTEKASATVGTAGQLLQRAPYAGGTLVSNALLDEDARGIKQVRQEKPLGLCFPRAFTYLNYPLDHYNRTYQRRKG